LYAQKAYNSDSVYDVAVRENALNIKRFTESELLKDLDAKGAHADELAEPLPQELTPLERLRGAVKRYDRPTDPVWDEFFNSDEGVTDDFMEDRDQPPPTPDTK
jgi:antitoxin VapB